MKKSISVVIPNYNGRRLLEKNLPTVIKALVHSGTKYEIIVPDDHSSDESVAFLKQNYPEIKVITSEQNLGFSGNINKGLRTAKMDLVMALNSDVTLNEDYFDHQFAYFDKPDVFGVMGSMKDPATDAIIVAAKVCRQNFFGDIEATKNIMATPALSLATFYLSGANALIDRQKLEFIGYFNEVYSPFYKEDTDLSLLAWRMNWQCLYEPHSISYHETSSTIAAYNKRQRIQFISKRNKFIFHYLHLSGFKRWLFFIKMGVDALVRWVALDVIFYKSLWAFFKRLPQVKAAQARLPVPLRSTQAVIADIARAQSVAKGSIF